MKDALIKGLEENSCPYRCREMPKSYRHPGRIITELEDEETTHKFLIDTVDKAWKLWELRCAFPFQWWTKNKNYKKLSKWSKFHEIESLKHLKAGWELNLKLCLYM